MQAWRERRSIDVGWTVVSTAPGAVAEPAQLSGLERVPARVPGTAAAALADAGRWDQESLLNFDAGDWWFSVPFEAERAEPGEEVVLKLGGIATVAEVYLNGELLLESASMFRSHEVDVTDRLLAENELVIGCRALAPLLAARRRPRARWRTAVAEGGLRFHRTSLIGRAPGFAPRPAPVGPWRPVELLRRRGLAVDRLRLRPSLEGGRATLSAQATLRAIGGPPPQRVEIEVGGSVTSLRVDEQPGGIGAAGRIALGEVAPWWPHTHGSPALHPLRLLADGSEIASARCGFRSLGTLRDTAAEGLSIAVNGVPTFLRGAVWPPLDAVSLAPSPAALRVALEQLRDAGMNMLRLPGVSAYESPAFHDLCDELGILVWQDFAFANFDYPIADAAFRAEVETEAEQLLEALGPRPSLAVLCGNSEVEQQVAMLGLDAGVGRGELFGELLPGLIEAAEVDAVYLPSSPCHGDLPFRPSTGVAHYFGVGAYRRPMEDARRADVGFASECLAFANVGDDTAGAAVHGREWKQGVPRDQGSGWDFDDVRDHYLALLFDVDPVALRSVDPERYLELSRAVSGEVMAEVMGEWRRAGSRCTGALILNSHDLRAGAGWGVIDSAGRPKAAYHHLRRALAPIAVWLTDEGLAGMTAHVANDRPDAVDCSLRLRLFANGQQLVGEAETALSVAAHATQAHDVEGLLGRFTDVAWAYGFGPPAQDMVSASLEREGEVFSQACRFPAGRPLHRWSPEELGLRAALTDGGLEVYARRVLYGARIDLPGWTADDDAFTLEPGQTKRIALRPARDEAQGSGGSLTAINLIGRLPIEDGR